jgi:hypothetical protein
VIPDDGHYRPKHVWSKVNKWNTVCTVGFISWYRPTEVHGSSTLGYKTCNVRLTFVARSPNHCCRGKAVSIKQSTCLYSCLRYPTNKQPLFCAALCYHLWPVWLYHTFPHSHKRHNFRQKFIEHKMCARFSLQLLSETFLILGVIRRGIIINAHRFSRKVTAILAGF